MAPGQSWVAEGPRTASGRGGLRVSKQPEAGILTQGPNHSLHLPGPHPALAAGKKKRGPPKR